MASRDPAAGLTKISFRRDVRSFLSILSVFLTAVILVLLILLQDLSNAAQQASLARYDAIADAASVEIASMADSEIDMRLRLLVARHGIDSIQIANRTFGRPRGIDEDEEIILTRRTRFGTARLVFHNTQSVALQKRVKLAATICVSAAVTGMILLFLYLPRITRPVEEMLDAAREVRAPDGTQDDASYLIETFRETINRLREQEAELKLLHKKERSRADELELVSETLTRSLTSGLITVDPEGRVVRANAAACETLGLKAGAEGRRLLDLIGNSLLGRALETTIATRQPLTRVEIDHPTRNGTLVIGLTAAPVLDEGSSLLGVLVLLTDLTPIKTLENRVRAMETLADLGEIAAGIAHEFRNSLSTILGRMRLAGRAATDDDAKRHLRAAESEALELSSAVERLLGFAKPMTLSIENVNLERLVADVTERLRETTPDVAFEMNGEAILEGDATLLARAVENIIRNAIDAIRQRGGPGLIAITLRQDPLELAIEDNGIGLAPSAGARLFLPFQSDKPGGFGLGLSLARKIVILHGGEIELTGKPGGGAVVTIRFPTRGR